MEVIKYVAKSLDQLKELRSCFWEYDETDIKKMDVVIDNLEKALSLLTKT